MSEGRIATLRPDCRARSVGQRFLTMYLIARRIAARDASGAEPSSNPAMAHRRLPRRLPGPGCAGGHATNPHRHRDRLVVHVTDGVAIGIFQLSRQLAERDELAFSDPEALSVKPTGEMATVRGTSPDRKVGERI